MLWQSPRIFGASCARRRMGAGGDGEREVEGGAIEGRSRQNGRKEGGHRGHLQWRRLSPFSRNATLREEPAGMEGRRREHAARLGNERRAAAPPQRCARSPGGA